MTRRHVKSEAVTGCIAAMMLALTSAAWTPGVRATEPTAAVAPQIGIASEYAKLLHGGSDRTARAGKGTRARAARPRTAFGFA